MNGGNKWKQTTKWYVTHIYFALHQQDLSSASTGFSEEENDYIDPTTEMSIEIKRRAAAAQLTIEDRRNE